MNAWLEKNHTVAIIGLTAIAGVLLVLTVILLVLWLLRRRAFRILAKDRAETEWTRIDRELTLAEQAGRLRIIRELQDIAIQSVTRLISRADAARYATEEDPQAAVRAAASLGVIGRDALGDMRRVLTVVSEGEAISIPTPGLRSVRDLFHVMREAGLVLNFTEDGERFELKQGAELAIYRILQGTLENSLTHGGPGTEVNVTFTWTTEGLKLVVDDDGIRAAARRSGLGSDEIDAQTHYSIDDDLRALTEDISGAGLTEMRERAQVFGGILVAHAVPGIGFSVSVAFPSLRFHNGVHAVNLTR